MVSTYFDILFYLKNFVICTFKKLLSVFHHRLQLGRKVSHGSTQRQVQVLGSHDLPQFVGLQLFVPYKGYFLSSGYKLTMPLLLYHCHFNLVIPQDIPVHLGISLVLTWAPSVVLSITLWVLFNLLIRLIVGDHVQMREFYVIYMSERMLSRNPSYYECCRLPWDMRSKSQL